MCALKKHSQLKKTRPGESGSSRRTPSYVPGIVSTDPARASYMNQGKIFIDKSFITGCGMGIDSCPGVYAICVINMDRYWETREYNSRVLYIGSSKNISRRVESPNHIYHIVYNRFRKTNVNAFVKWYKTDDYLKLEKELIQLVKPILNKFTY